tara:strand:- start:4043 stop:4243 length:201 start_codon:yes stop_codon:yes gene_type:complete
MVVVENLIAGYVMTDETEKLKKGTGILESLDNATKEDWAEAQRRVEEAEKSSDEWLKGLIDEYDRK